MKIAVISPRYPPEVGGVGEVVQQTSENLVRLDPSAAVEVWSNADVAASTESVENGVTVRRFPTSGPTHYPFSAQLFSHARQAARDVDILHAHNFHSLTSMIGIAAARRTPVVVTLHFHGGGHTRPARLLHQLYRPVARRALRRAAGIGSVSEAERAMVLEHFPELEPKLRVVRNGVDTELIASARPFDRPQPTILVLSRHEGYKRIDRVIDAFAAVSDRAQLVVLGSGPATQALMQQAAPLGDAVLFPGRVSAADRDRWLRTASVVVSASEHEAFGLAPMEGAAAGADILLSDIPAHRELLTLAPAGAVRIVDTAPGPLGSAFVEALAGPATRTPRRSVRSWHAVAEDHLAWYQSVLDARG